MNDLYNKKSSIKELKAKLGSSCKEDESLAKYTTFKIGGPADLFLIATTKEEFVNAITSARKLGIPVCVMGGGSNVLVSDVGFRGLVISNAVITFI